MQGNYLEQALGMIHSRRLAAEQQNRERIMEIESRIPEVSEVNYQMFRTNGWQPCGSRTYRLRR